MDISIIVSLILKTCFTELSGFRDLIKVKLRVEFPLDWPWKVIGQSENSWSIQYVSTIIEWALLKERSNHCPHGALSEARKVNK